jgi:hypothetical protein
MVLHRGGARATVCGPAFGAACVDLTTGTWQWRRDEPCMSMAVDPQGGLLLLLLGDGRLVEVDDERGELRRELWRGDTYGAGVGFWGDGSRILVNDSRTHVLVRASGRELLALPGGRFAPASLCGDAGRGYLILGGGHFREPAELRLWPLRRP